MFTVQKLTIENGDLGFTSEGFRQIVEDHLVYFRSKDSTVIQLEPHDEYMYIGDLFGLLTKLNFEVALHWIIMRVNNLTSPIDYKGDLQYLIIPQKNKLNILLARYLNNYVNG
jgi:hypothetical protein